MSYCHECKYWDVAYDEVIEGDKTFSYCKRNAPVIFAPSGIHAVWPLVSEDTHACGEFKKGKK